MQGFRGNTVTINGETWPHSHDLCLQCDSIREIHFLTNVRLKIKLEPLPTITGDTRFVDDGSHEWDRSSRLEQWRRAFVKDGRRIRKYIILNQISYDALVWMRMWWPGFITSHTYLCLWFSTYVCGLDDLKSWKNNQFDFIPRKGFHGFHGFNLTFYLLKKTQFLKCSPHQELRILVSLGCSLPCWAGVALQGRACKCERLERGV